ncbi:hypothetical protein [Luteolibacter sp.]|uniref:hypothetical protein n=2 Tax=Luteolibacter sp. TaxID=1962973 RepID=UPI0032647A89
MLNKRSALIPMVSLLGASALGAFADGSAGATAVTSAVSGLAADAGTGVGAGILIGVVVFGARVVWRAVKSMAH